MKQNFSVSSSCSELSESLDTATKDEKDKIVRAIDRRLLPLLGLFYFINFLDRGNIGNAKLQGMPEQLSTNSYIKSDEPRNIWVLYYLYYIRGTGQHNVEENEYRPWSFRNDVDLGVTESGYLPGTLFYLTRIYPSDILCLRISYILIITTFSGAVSGPVAYTTSYLEGKGNLHSWQYLFLIEGISTILVSFVSYMLLFDDIGKVQWLSDDQKKLHSKMIASTEEATAEGRRNVQFRDVKAAFLNWKTYAFAIVFFAESVILICISIFVPTIIEGFGFSSLQSQLLSAPPSVVACATLFLAGVLDNRYNCAASLIVVGFVATSIAYALLFLLHSPWALYGALLFCTSGMGLSVPPLVTWAAVSFANPTERAIALALITSIGHTGSVAGAFLFPSTDAPVYYMGKVCNMGLAAMGAIVTLVISFSARREKRLHELNMAA
ncbi:hypothetical protein EC973_007759 [Apophysomyces ossiformis]|uniref:Uncharacterized protein n=1 Tax=Apophysomyces ossiformis TaxID=679940 RepID=A0A8H7BXN2_9FUNG|nr:hypothetical protein EC973_007759 [Apophysomyces ossiformis]